MKGKVNGGQLCAERGDHFRWDFPRYIKNLFYWRKTEFCRVTFLRLAGNVFLFNFGAIKMR